MELKNIIRSNEAPASLINVDYDGYHAARKAKEKRKELADMTINNSKRIDELSSKMDDISGKMELILQLLQKG